MFWAKMVDNRTGSGMEHISGWITAWASGLGTPEASRSSWTTPRTPSSTPRTSSIGLAEVDVLVNDNGIEFQTLMVAGLEDTRVLSSGEDVISKGGAMYTLVPLVA